MLSNGQIKHFEYRDFYKFIDQDGMNLGWKIQNYQAHLFIAFIIFLSDLELISFLLFQDSLIIFSKELVFITQL